MTGDCPGPRANSQDRAEGSRLGHAGVDRISIDSRAPGTASRDVWDAVIPVDLGSAMSTKSSLQRPMIEAAMSKPNIAFVSTYEHPSRDSIERTIGEAFPEFRLEHVAVRDVLKANRR
jgi:hypothetical protein